TVRWPRPELDPDRRTCSFGGRQLAGSADVSPPASARAAPGPDASQVVGTLDRRQSRMAAWVVAGCADWDVPLAIPVTGENALVHYPLTVHRRDTVLALLRP